MVEYKAKRFFSDQTLAQFIDPLRLAQVAIEYFISQVLYSGDWSRVIYSTDDICYRRRVELLGQGNINKGQTAPVAQTLGLPFSNYNQKEEWDDDKRLAAIQAGQFVLGMYDPDFDATVRCAAIESKFSVTTHFGRRDDLRLATQLIYWEKYLKYPFYFNNYVTFGKTRLCIPTNITIENITSNLDYQESKWLSDSKIFPMKIEMMARSYEVLLRTVQNTEFDGVTSVPIRFRNHHDEMPDYMVTRPLVETTLLHFGVAKFGFDTNKTMIKKAFRAKKIDLMNAGIGYKVGDELYKSINGFILVTARIMDVDNEGGIRGFSCTRAASYTNFESSTQVIEDDGTNYLADKFEGGSGTGAEFRIKTEEFTPDPEIEVYTPDTFTKQVVDLQKIDITSEEYGAASPLHKELESGHWQRSIIEGYFSNVEQLVFKSFGITDPDKGTLINELTGKPDENGIPFDPCTMHVISYTINILEDPFVHLEIIVDSRIPYFIERPENMTLNSTIDGSLLIKGLYPNSEYNIKLIAFYESGESVLAQLGPGVTRTAKDTTPVFKNNDTGQIIKTENKDAIPEGFEQLTQGPVGATESDPLIDFDGRTLDEQQDKKVVNDVIFIEGELPEEKELTNTIKETKEETTYTPPIPGKGKDPLIGFVWEE